MEGKQNIIIKRVKKVSGGHHGGSWKIAMADFAIAMMAFFLLMWLLANTTEAQKIELEQFFSDPMGYMDKVGRLSAVDLGGSPTILNNFNPSDASEQIEAAQTLQTADTEPLGSAPERETLEELKASLLSTVESNEVLNKFKDQLIIDIAPDGLHIQIVDNQQRPMFDAGSDRLKYYFAEILLQLTPTLSRVNNKLSIHGHTDSTPYADRDYFSNWELSANRANAARRMLMEGGLPDGRVAQVVGLSDSALFLRDDPQNPINRRIEIVILNRQAEQALEAQTGDRLSEEARQRLEEARRQQIERQRLGLESQPGTGLQNRPLPPPAAESVEGTQNPDARLQDILRNQDNQRYQPPAEVD
ncbi:chemotaxis protein MotB [Allopseudospirillum japonicum]|uniref:Chemotaxis protein MotB n=1 Tax=Allopseudospirillum japonicum TaxID=64971 RepID=A0A1H6QCK9_9GAMM|nr:flagellar motor protein MotB [Allopseudospirillum japonicum]SEI41431.1 chemotaxis protein MotB [Allopseudospirillum japonicum]